MGKVIKQHLCIGVGYKVEKLSILNITQNGAPMGVPQVQGIRRRKENKNEESYKTIFVYRG